MLTDRFDCSSTYCPTVWPYMHLLIKPDHHCVTMQRGEDLVLRDFNYCIIDEVDSILIDEARTPLIISGPAEKPSEK